MGKFPENRGGTTHLSSACHRCSTVFIRRERRRGRKEPVFTQPQDFRIPGSVQDEGEKSVQPILGLRLVMRIVFKFILRKE